MTTLEQTEQAVAALDEHTRAALTNAKLAATFPWQAWPGPVEHCGTIYRTRDEFVEAYLDDADLDLWDPDPLVVPCSTFHPQIDVEAAMEDALCQDEMHEEAHFEHVEELKAFVAAWNAKQTCESWMPRDSRRQTVDFADFPWLEWATEDSRWAGLRARIANPTPECLLAEQDVPV